MIQEKNNLSIWFKSNEILGDIVNAIQSRNKSVEETAKMVFYEVSDYFRLPKQPEDITEQMYKEGEESGFEPESVFEQMALVNYLAEGNDDKIGLVMQALYSVYHRDYYRLEDTAEIYFGGADKIPQSYICYLFGNDIDARIEFTIKEKSWTDAGAKMMKKII